MTSQTKIYFHLAFPVNLRMVEWERREEEESKKNEYLGNVKNAFW